MPEAQPNLILYPVFAMFALVAFVLAKMARLRFGAVRRGEMDPAFYRTYQNGEEPEHIRVVTRHFINLMEMPMMFYVVVVLTYISHQVSVWMIGCAWAYVAVRYAHSYVHLTHNNVLTRFQLYLGSALILAVMYGTLLVRLLSAD